jgi:hypothetical protein
MTQKDLDILNYINSLISNTPNLEIRETLSKVTQFIRSFNDVPEPSKGFCSICRTPNPPKFPNRIYCRSCREQFID